LRRRGVREIAAVIYDALRHTFAKTAAVECKSVRSKKVLEGLLLEIAGRRTGGRIDSTTFNVQRANETINGTGEVTQRNATTERGPWSTCAVKVIALPTGASVLIVDFLQARICGTIKLFYAVIEKLGIDRSGTTECSRIRERSE
jgi:hypothetical protein